MKKLVALFVLLLTLACCTTEADRTRMRAGLDSINQRNRNDQPFTVQDVEPYVQFFDHHGTSNDRLLAHYLLGRAYHEQNDMPLALRNYYDAINQVDTTSSKCDFNQLSRVYGQIAELYHQQHAPRLEILAERKAIEYAWRAKDTLTAILFYSYLDGPYHMLNLMDSALFYNQEAIKLLKHYGYPELAAGLLPMSIDIY